MPSASRALRFPELPGVAALASERRAASASRIAVSVIAGLAGRAAGPRRARAASQKRQRLGEEVGAPKLPDLSASQYGSPPMAAVQGTPGSISGPMRARSRRGFHDRARRLAARHHEGPHARFASARATWRKASSIRRAERSRPSRLHRRDLAGAAVL
jgi:hypothetical protein